MLIAFSVLMSFLSQHPVDGNFYYFLYLQVLLC